MINILFLVICTWWVCNVQGVCPSWSANEPCSCIDTKDGMMVRCTGPSTSHQMISALEEMRTVGSWDLQLDSLDLEDLPSSVKTVSSLRLSNCNLERLQKTSPLLWPKLNEIVFESVMIRSTPWPQFKGARVLKSIKVSDFPTMRTIGQSFKSLPSSIEYMDLRKTGTTKLEPGCMTHFRNLLYVFIADMPLTEFPRNTLPPELPQLHTFILGNTLVDKLEANFFDGMPKLEVLWLDGNKFATLDSRLFMPLKSHLTHFLAERNPLQCECSLLWLKRNFKNKQSLKVLATCFDVDMQEYKEVMKLNEDDYCS